MKVQEVTAESLVGSRKVYMDNGDLPPGSVPVQSRTLSRYVSPGAERQAHGVPPIAYIGLPDGWIVGELSETDENEIRVLPFRFPWYSRAYGLLCGAFCAVMRNIRPMELTNGTPAVVQFNEARDWTAVYGLVVKAESGWFKLVTPNGTELDVPHESVHFVGKVACWWRD